MPKRQRVVVVNTTPIISLALVGQLSLIHSLYDEVLIPPAVEAEILAGVTKNTKAVDLDNNPYIRVVMLRDSNRAVLLADLDRGEAEVISLAQELVADLVVIDERLARRHAKRLGLYVTGTLGVLLKAKECGKIPEVKSVIMELQRGGIYLSDELVTQSLILAGEQ